MAKKFKATISGAEYEALADDIKDFYVRDGERYVADLDGAETSESIQALKNAKQREATEKTQFKNQLEQYQSMFGDAKPEEVQRLIAQANKEREEALKTAGQWDEMKAQMRKEFEEKELLPARTAAEKYKKAAEKFLVESQFRKAVDELKPFEGAADVLLPHALRNIRLVEDNGEIAARIYDGDTLQVNSKGEPLSFTEFADKTFRQSPIFGRFFQPDDTAGSGSPAFSNNGGSFSGSRVISSGDQKAINANVDAIAKGEVTVR